MDKKILQDYVDACELIKETEDDLRKLRKTEVVHDKVTGSNPEFPYQAQSFNLTGTVETEIDSKNLQKEKDLLLQRCKRAKQIKIQVERWMNTIPLRMQRIIRYKIFERLSWQEVAIKMGNDVTADSVRMEYYKFMKKEK